ncbi:MAG: hypothetical protein ACRDUY_14285 [Nitriliruptorales bacterium]
MDWIVHWFMLPVCVGIASVAMFSGISDGMPRVDDRVAVPMSEPHAERPGRTGRSAVAAGLLATVALGALWAVLAAVRPGVTFHLAPTILAGAYAWLRWLDEPPPSATGALGTVVLGAVFAIAETFALAGVGWLEGPALVGGNALGESIIAVAVGAFLAAALVLRRSSTHDRTG